MVLFAKKVKYCIALKVQASLKEKTAFIAHLEKQLQDSKILIENEVHVNRFMMILID